MEVVNLLDFLNRTKDLYTLKYARCTDSLINFLDLMTEAEQFTQNIDLGIIYVNQKTLDQYTIVDGLKRILSLSLLLHAICECYKKTTEQNEKAIQTIRQKYILSELDESKAKLYLPEKENIIYNKIISGERLSGKEKNSQLFILLHSFWTQIKTENIQAAHIFRMLQKITVTIVDTEDVSERNLYYKLNSNRKLNQNILIEDYMEENFVLEEWLKTKKKCFAVNSDVISFFKDFFITKFNYKQFNEDRLYESFVNYFETMKRYMPREKIINKLCKSAHLYSDILNVNFSNAEIKNALINIKKSNGEDTFAYILDVYNDFHEDNLSESTFIEILNTIAEYLNNRKNTNNNINFNELIQYLNAFLACK